MRRLDLMCQKYASPAPSISRIQHSAPRSRVAVNASHPPPPPPPSAPQRGSGPWGSRGLATTGRAPPQPCRTIDAEFRKAWMPFFCRSGHPVVTPDQFLGFVGRLLPQEPFLTLLRIAGRDLQEVARAKKSLLPGDWMVGRGTRSKRFWQVIPSQSRG